MSDAGGFRLWAEPDHCIGLSDHATWPEIDPLCADQAVALMLLGEILFCLWATTSGDEKTIGLYVNCNDVFAYACADCEPLPLVGFCNGGDEEVIRLYDLVRRAGGYGAIAWAVTRRKQRPIPPRVARLKELDLWTAEMEALP